MKIYLKQGNEKWEVPIDNARFQIELINGLQRFEHYGVQYQKTGRFHAGLRIYEYVCDLTH